MATINQSVPVAIGTISANLTLNSSYVPTANRSEVVVGVRFRYLTDKTTGATSWQPVDSEIRVDSNNAAGLLA